MPVISGPENTILTGESFTLNCVSSDHNTPIIWSLMDTTINPSSSGIDAEIMGQYNMSVLTVTNTRLENGGMYMCHVGNTTASFMVNVAMGPTTASESSCESTHLNK